MSIQWKLSDIKNENQLVYFDRSSKCKFSSLFCYLYINSSCWFCVSIELQKYGFCLTLNVCAHSTMQREASVRDKNYRALKEHTASDALPEKGKSANQSAHVFALGYFLSRRYYMVAHGCKFYLPMFNSIAYE